MISFPGRFLYVGFSVPRKGTTFSSMVMFASGTYCHRSYLNHAPLIHNRLKLLFGPRIIVCCHVVKSQSTHQPLESGFSPIWCARNGTNIRHILLQIAIHLCEHYTNQHPIFSAVGSFLVAFWPIVPQHGHVNSIIYSTINKIIYALTISLSFRTWSPRLDRPMKYFFAGTCVCTGIWVDHCGPSSPFLFYPAALKDSGVLS